jgi:hypothetical protein
MLKILTAIIAILILPAPSHAQVGIPSQIILEMQGPATACQSLGKVFSYDMRYLIKQDITADSLPDYIISSAGYLCDNDHKMFADPLGDTYQIYRAGTDGLYTRYTPGFRAYELTLEPRNERRVLNFRVACDPALKSERRGITRLEWEHDEGTFTVHQRELGCSAKKKRRDREDKGWFDGGWFDFDIDNKNEPLKLQD